MKKILLVITLAAVIGATMLVGCSSYIPRQVPQEKLFPTIRGESLTGEKVVLPRDLNGAPAILLVGYAQRAQFDIDRWILGLKQLNSTVKLLELPTIPGMVPGILSERIVGGMKQGIPEEDWRSVVTVFSDADTLVQLTGNENPNNARVMLVDKAGTIRWFYDRGYSANQVTELAELAKVLE